MSGCKNHLEDELKELRLQQQKKQGITEMEPQMSSADDVGLKKQEKEKSGDDFEVVTMPHELKSVKEEETKLIEVLREVLRDTAEKMDQKQTVFSGELVQKMDSVRQQKSPTSQELFQQNWLMVNDLDTLSKQPDVESLSRQEFKQKVVEMAREKWVPRNLEYVENRVEDLRSEMKTVCDNCLSRLVKNMSEVIKYNMTKSMKLVDELQNACEEERKMRGE